MNDDYSFTIASHLQASAERVWAHASTFEGVNRELRPLLRMTYPPRRAVLPPETIPVGRFAFRSWFLLCGLVPVEYDDITIVELEPGRGFYEVSRMMAMQQWRHRRTVVPAGEGCVLTDEVAFVPKWRPAGPLLARVCRLVFVGRHRSLRNLFGGNE
jgi:ligand-binding SRPBCC domain-containing protein